MYRKRLLGMFTALLLGLSAGPAAAIGASLDQPAQAPVKTPAVTDLVKVGEGAYGSSLDLADPEVDESIEGVGHIYVDIDEENQTLTVGVGVEPLGVDETVTLPPASAGGDEEEAPAEPTAEEVAQTETKAEMEQAKDEAAEEAAGQARPAFSSGNLLEPASGRVVSGAGVSSSTRPPATAPAPGDNAASPIADAAVNNPWLRIMGVVMLAGTSTAWSIAKREGLA